MVAGFFTDDERLTGYAAYEEEQFPDTVYVLVTSNLHISYISADSQNIVNAYGDTGDSYNEPNFIQGLASVFGQQHIPNVVKVQTDDSVIGLRLVDL